MKIDTVSPEQLLYIAQRMAVQNMQQYVWLQRAAKNLQEKLQVLHKENETLEFNINTPAQQEVSVAAEKLRVAIKKYAAPKGLGIRPTAADIAAEKQRLSALRVGCMKMHLVDLLELAQAYVFEAQGDNEKMLRLLNDVQREQKSSRAYLRSLHDPYAGMTHIEMDSAQRSAASYLYAGYEASNPYSQGIKRLENEITCMIRDDLISLIKSI